MPSKSASKPESALEPLPHLHAWLDSLRIERRLSRHTLSSYSRDLQRLADCIHQQQQSDPRQPIPLEQIQTLRSNDIRAMVARLHRQGLGGRSIARWLSAVRGWLGYLLKHGQLQDNPAHSIKAPKSSRKLPATLEVDDLDQLLDLPADEPLAIRDKAMLELFYSSGLRLAELAALDWPDIDMHNGLVTVTGKGNKQRILPVGRMAKQALLNWQQIHSDFCSGLSRPALFISQRGQRLTHRAIQKRLRYWSTRLGMAKHVHPHKLRHSFASHLLESSGALRSVQELLGHANISTTQIYTHLDFQHLAKVYDKAHPRAKKK